MKALVIILTLAATLPAMTLHGMYTLRAEPEAPTYQPSTITIGLSDAIGNFGVGGSVGIGAGEGPGDVPGLTLSLSAATPVGESTVGYITINDIRLTNVKRGTFVCVGFRVEL